MLLTGAQIIMECLLEQDATTVFGYPGGAVLNIYDALYSTGTRSTTLKPLTSRARPTLPTGMPVPAEKPAFALPLRAPARQTL